MSGYLCIDHRQGQNPDGSKGTLEEYCTINCIHCQDMIAIISAPAAKYSIDHLDIWAVTGMAPSLSERFVGRCTCPKCRGHVHPFTGERSCGAICRGCAAVMEITKKCPGPWDAQVERMKVGKPRDGGTGVLIAAS